jgi:hypothetical protein
MTVEEIVGEPLLVHGIEPGRTAGSSGCARCSRSAACRRASSTAIHTR